jgi:hypothetical protein
LHDNNNDNNNDSDILLESLKCDELLAWVDVHDIELQGNGRWMKKKGVLRTVFIPLPSLSLHTELIDIITQAPKSEQPTKEHLKDIIYGVHF